MKRARNWASSGATLRVGIIDGDPRHSATRVRAAREVLGPVPVQRCIRHKERNVLGHLAERDRPAVRHRLRRAWAETDHDHALSALQTLAGELEHSHPGACAPR